MPATSAGKESAPVKSEAEKAREKAKAKALEKAKAKEKEKAARKSERAAKRARVVEDSDDDDLFNAFPDPIPVPDDDFGPITLLSGAVGAGVMFDASNVGEKKPLPIPSDFVQFAREMIALYNKNLHKRHGTTAVNVSNVVNFSIEFLSNVGRMDC